MEYYLASNGKNFRKTDELRMCFIKWGQTIPQRSLRVLSCAESNKCVCLSKHTCEYSVTWRKS